MPMPRLRPWILALASVRVVCLAPAHAASPIVVSDPSQVDVCQRVPGVDVAKALGKVLKSERPVIFKDSKLSRCVYLLAAAARPDESLGLVLWLYAPQEYAELNRVTEASLEKLPGLGDEAVRFRDQGDGRHKLRVLRRGRYSIESTAPDAASALALAKLAVERFDR
jgi:hypothetical protein